jgi:hypothetical protein
MPATGVHYSRPELIQSQAVGFGEEGWRNDNCAAKVMLNTRENPQIYDASQ